MNHNLQAKTSLAKQDNRKFMLIRLDEWTKYSNRPQIDDVLVMGVRL